MPNIFNQDFRDFIDALNKNEVRYLLVGGYAVILHGHARTTGDMDIWVDSTKANYRKLVRAFGDFGMGVFDMTEEKFLNTIEYDVFRFGRNPVAIDIMTKMSRFSFEDAYNKITWFEDEGLKIPVIHINTLIEAKKAAGRQKDLNDLVWLGNNE